MRTFLSKVWIWLKYSSVNAEKISLTFKGIATAIIPVVLFFLNAYKVNVDSNVVSNIINGISASIIVVGGLIASIMTVIGTLRKIWTSINNTNEVIASFND